jgi:dipeptidyl aminopeptidase/acylaminoacyl peptidase
LHIRQRLPPLSRIALLAGLAVVGFGSQPNRLIAQQQRRFRVDDLFALEDMGRYYGGPYDFSPDEQRLAFTRVRAESTLTNHEWDDLWGNAGGDIWVQMSPTAPPVNITGGLQDGSGWWAPQWSPDGRRLAMLSTRGDNVRLWIWDRQTRALQQLTTRGVALKYSPRERPYRWVDARRILIPVLPGDAKPGGMVIETRTPAIASTEWPKALAGDEVTASVLQSGVPVDLNSRPQGDLLRVDVVTGTAQVVIHGTIGSWRLAPRVEELAFTRPSTPYTPAADEPLPLGVAIPQVAAIEVVKLDGTPVALRGEVSPDVVEGSLRWAPDGHALAFFGYPGRAQPPSLYLLKLADRIVVRRTLPELDITTMRQAGQEVQLEWVSGGALIFVAAKRAEGGGVPGVTARRDWWCLRADGSLKNLTEGFTTVPSELWPQEGRAAFVGLAGGELWRIEPLSGKVANLTARLRPPVARLAWPARTYRGTDQYRLPGRTYDQVVLAVEEGPDQSPYVVDLRAGETRRLETPAPGAELVEYGPTTRTAIFWASDRQGLRVWRSDPDRGQPMLLAEANTFLRNVAEGALIPIEYTSLNGEPLKGWVILPVGYRRGKRYPLLTWVYAGAVWDKRPFGAISSINSSSSLNLQIPAANGYAVLLPSMPLAPPGQTDDPLLRLPEGVLPAVDKAIELGIADPARLFLMGQSFGGFSTYGLVTQTRRFRAAVALAGLSDLISLYGQFDARARYTDAPQENLFTMSLLESGQGKMGSPPWKDIGRYLRNSPIFFVDRVETPIMIVQGDLDYVAMQQGEEFFNSLYRQGKRAAFVRYWGEGHVIESPANIRDVWKRIFAWFDEFSPKAEENAVASP